MNRAVEVLLWLAFFAVCFSPFIAAMEMQEARQPPGEPPANGLSNVRVIDGDTIHAAVGNDWEQIRLLGIDTPETTQETAPGEWEGVTSRECLRRVGLEAKDRLAGFIRSGQTTLETDPESDRRGYYDRLLGYVQDGETNVNYWLVANGYARYYESNFSQSGRFEQAEQQARANEKGAWNCQ